MGFDITGLGSVFDFGGKIIDKFWPNKADADRAKLELLKMQQDGEFRELEAILEIAKQQTSVNTAEAQSGSNFRGGWRPFIGWVCGTGLAYATIVRPIAIGVTRIWFPDFELPEAGTEALMTLLFGMLGLGGMRTLERVKK